MTAYPCSRVSPKPRPSEVDWMAAGYNLSTDPYSARGKPCSHRWSIGLGDSFSSSGAAPRNILSPVCKLLSLVASRHLQHKSSSPIEAASAGKILYPLCQRNKSNQMDGLPPSAFPPCSSDIRFLFELSSRDNACHTLRSLPRRFVAPRDPLGPRSRVDCLPLVRTIAQLCGLME